VFDPITLLAGGALVGGGYLSGRIGRKRRHPTPPPPPEPICGCTHGYHDHDPQTKACHGLAKAYRWNGSRDREVFDKYVPCTCRRYTGPTPYDEYIATEIGS
jgi:hypothetical protein